MPRNNHNEKLVSLAHYLIARTRPHELGATKLNKAMWWIDCAAMRKFNSSISGLESYARLPNGPAPDRYEDLLAELKARGLVQEAPGATAIGFPRREFCAVSEPDISQFSAAEVDLIHQVLDEIRSMSAQEVSERSHDALWAETPTGGRMSVRAGSVISRPISESDLEWARSEASRLGP